MLAEGVERIRVMKTLLRLTIAALLALLSSFAIAGPPGQPGLEAKVDRYLQPYVKLHAYIGVVYVGKGDEVALAKPYGMANEEFGVPNCLDTRFAIASISKRFTSIVVARLVAEKKLAYSDTLAKWVPDFPSADRITGDSARRDRETPRAASITAL
jgi:CubicO group peptidase (beta-lactamase class C family)